MNHLPDMQQNSNDYNSDNGSHAVRQQFAKARHLKQK